MPIHIILGKPGSGKSLYAVTRVIAELREGKRNVVTNLPLKLGRLNEYLQERYPDEKIDVIGRVRLLDEEELRTFWKFRGPDPLPGEEQQGYRAVAYFLDEAHIAFNARDWAVLGREAIHYMSQHRKFGDVVWPITQAPGNLDKQFRSVAEDFTVLRNEYTAKFGIFRGRGRFVRRTYLSEPRDRAEPFETATFQLDVPGVASCYDTAVGIGVHGDKADIGRRAKGIPIGWVIPGALVLASMAVFIPWMMGKAAGKYLTGGASVEAKAPTRAVQHQERETETLRSVTTTARNDHLHQERETETLRSVTTTARNDHLTKAVTLPVPWVAVDKPPTPLYVTGVIIGRGLWSVTLSDGRVLTEQDRMVATIDRRGIILNEKHGGLRIPMQPVGAGKPNTKTTVSASVSTDRIQKNS